MAQRIGIHKAPGMEKAFQLIKATYPNHRLRESTQLQRGRMLMCPVTLSNLEGISMKAIVARSHRVPAHLIQETGRFRFRISVEA